MVTTVHSWVVYIVLLAMVLLAALFDYKNHRIPNWLSFSGWYLGPLLHYFIAGAPSLYSSLLALVVVFVITFPLFAVRWMGAGDVKLMTSVAALVGVDQALFYLAAIFIAGLLIGILQLLMRGVFVSFVRRYWMMIGISMLSERPVYIEQSDAQRQIVMPYAISIAIGTIAAVCLF